MRARMPGLLTALACTAAVAAPPAGATVFYGVDAQSRLVRFDPFSSAFRDALPLTGPGASSVLALDVRPGTGGLFAVTRSAGGIQLARIDQGTGALTPIGLPVSISGVIAGASMDVHEVRDDAQVLIDTGGTDSSLHLDLDTGAVSDPGNLAGGTDFVGLAWSPATNGSAPLAVEVDALTNHLSFGDPTGLTSDIGPLGVALGQTTSLDFAPDLVLWMYGRATAPQHVYGVDWLTGHATSIVQVAPLKAFSVQLTGGIAFGSGAIGAAEGDGAAAVTLQRAAPAESVAKVHWSTTGGTATAGADYTAASGDVTFARGETSKAVNVPLLQDSAVEGTERVTLHLDSVDGVPAGADAQLVIADDDQPPPPGPPPAAIDTAAPVLLALPVKLAAKRSLKLPFALSEAGLVTVTLKLKPALAKQLKLSATLAAATLRGAAGENTAVLKLSRKEARKLRSRRSTKATADIVATDAAGNRATRTMKVTLT